MVKKTLFSLSVGVLLLMGLMVGCNKPANPVVPANSAVLNLIIPSQVLNAKPTSKSLSALPKEAVPDTYDEGAFEYYLVTAGEAPVTGVILYNSGSEVGNIFINLPKAGNWLVSGEWFEVSNPEDTVQKPKAKLVLPGLNTYPEFAGADEVNVQGTTSFTLNMEDIGYQEYECYQAANLTDSTNCDYNDGGGATFYYGNYEDIYSFNSGAVTASIPPFGGTGDIQALYDVTSLSTYLSAPSTYVGAGPPPPRPSIFTYLGNGDLVNFPVIPAGAVFYPNTLQAKAAVVGSAAATLAGNDIFVVKTLSTNALAWVQLSAPYNDGCIAAPNSSLLSFVFVYQNEGLNYMKFDQTTNGAANCNENNPLPSVHPK
jgi:hypothetical protein